MDYNCTTEQWRHTCPETDKYKGGSEVIRRVRRRGAITGGTRFLQRPATWDLPQRPPTQTTARPLRLTLGCPAGASCACGWRPAPSRTGAPVWLGLRLVSGRAGQAEHIYRLAEAGRGWPRLTEADRS